MQYTENYSLKLPGYGDNADVGDLNDNTTSIDALIHANRQIEAPAFSTTTAYTAGEMCVYENVLYKFTANKAAGNWDSTKVTATNLADEVTDAAQSGGTEVEANPVEAATSDLHKLKVDTTVYGIPDPTVTKTATGNPIEFSDAASAPMVRCETEIQGSQDLHGYDKPWVGGAGKNLTPPISFPLSGNQILRDLGTEKTFNGLTLSLKFSGSFDPGNGYFVCCRDANNVITFQTTMVNLKKVSDNTNLVKNTIYTDEYVYYSTPNPIVVKQIVFFNYTTFTNPIFNEMQLEEGDRSSYAPYSNICPITAYTEGEIEVRGKNMLETTATTSTVAGITYTPQSDGSIKYSGTASGASEYVINDHVPLKVSMGTVILSGLANTDNLLWNSFYLYDENGTNIGSVTVTGKADKTIDLSNYTGLSYGRIAVKRNANIQCSGTIYPMIRYASVSDSTWEPYIAPTTHTTTYPSAIYRGSEDVVNGEVTSEMPVIDLGSLTWTRGGTSVAGKYRFYATIQGNVASDIDNPHSISSHFSLVKSYETYTNLKDGYVLGSDNKIYIYMESYSDYTVQDFVTAITGAQLAYELATPTTSSVTPTNLPIKSLSGFNHIESSTGDMEVEYITQTYQLLVDLIDEAAEQREAYSTDEQEVGTWVDGSKLYQKTYIFSGTGAANPYSTTVDMTGKTITNVIPHYAKYTYNGGTVGYCVGSRLTANNSNVLTVQYNDEAPPTLDVIANLGGSTETYEVCFTLQYVKTSSNNRSLSKGATDSLKADLSEVKGESEESVDKVDKVDEPTETIEEKEENAGESNSENER